MHQPPLTALGVSMLVSVIVPAFNVVECIGRVIDSVLNQSLRDLEVIIVDDCSTDSTVEYVKQRAAQDTRIRLLRNDINRGPAAARNRGIAAARGEWIAVVDADDACHHERLATLCAVATSNKADLIADNLQLYDAVAQRVTAVALEDMAADEVIIVDTKKYLNNCITARSKFDFGQLKGMMRKSFLTRHELWYPEAVRHGEDFILYAKMLLAGARFTLVGSPYYLFTERVGRLSAQPSGLSRTKLNFDAMHESTLELLSHPNVRNNVQLEKPLKERANAIRWHQSRIVVNECTQRRDIAGLLRECLRDWRATALLANKVVRRFHYSVSPSL